MKFFRQFPTVTYNDSQTKNFIASVRIDQLVSKTYQAYYPYALQDGESAWMVADAYYGSPDFVWLVYMSNNITDPYFDWYMETPMFENYIKKKYGSIAAAKSNVKEYRYGGATYSPDSYTYSTDENKASWESWSAYDVENETNENKREIVLLSNRYARQAELNLKELMKSYPTLG